MSSLSLERRISHGFRLDILCCLVDGTLSLTALSNRLEKPLTTVAYHLRVLEDRDVVEKIDGMEDEDPVYAARLDRHPPWVAEAVANHKDRDSVRPDSVPAVRVVIGMKCDECERLLRHEGQVVAVYRKDGEREAMVITEDSARPDEAVNRRTAEKYHRGCYAEARERDPFLPPVRD